MPVSRNDGSGRDQRGRFQAGTPGGPGNPHAVRVARIRSALLEALTDEDVRAILSKLVELAKAGDVAAAKEVLDRAIGKPAALDLEEERILTERHFGDLCSALLGVVRRRFAPEDADALLDELTALMREVPSRRRRT